mgnify:CR=1 FL=1
MWQGDYHTHSTLDDGKSTLEEMAAAAHALGLPRFGFSGHSWCPWEEDYCMPRDWVEEYLTTVRAPGPVRWENGDLPGAGAGFYGERPQGLD